MITQIIVSKSCSHVCPTPPHTPASGPAPIWLHWKKSDKSWDKNWKRCTFVFFFNGLRQLSKFWSWVYCCPKQQMCNLVTENKEEEEEEDEVVILTHPRIPDVLLLPVNGPRYAKNVWSVERIYWNTFPLIALLSQLLGGCFQRLARNISKHLTEGKNGSVVPAVHTKRD